MNKKITVRAVRTAVVIVAMCLILAFALLIDYFAIDFLCEDLKTGKGIFNDKKMPNAAWLLQNISYLMPIILLVALQALVYCRKKDKDAYSYLERGIQAVLITVLLFCVALPIIAMYGKGLESLAEEALKNKTPIIDFQKIGQKIIDMLNAKIQDTQSDKYITYNDAITRWTLDNVSKILDPDIVKGVIIWFGRQIVPCIILIAYNFIRFDSLKHPLPDCGADEEFDADDKDLEYENKVINEIANKTHRKTEEKKQDSKSDTQKETNDDNSTKVGKNKKEGKSVGAKANKNQKSSKKK